CRGSSGVHVSAQRLRQMGAKCKAKAEVNPCIGKAQLNGKAKPNVKATVEDMPYGQDQDQNQDQPKQPGVGSIRKLGGDCAQPGRPMGKLGSQAVKYQLKVLVAMYLDKNTPHP
ncbi:MAG: hypothetical protein ACKPKO_30895, partial [Candidatus Fonsibacter sp.]